MAFSPIGALLGGAFLYGGGTEGIKSMVSGNNSIPAMSPMQLNPALGLSQEQRSNFQDIVNKKPLYKGASGGNMPNHLSIATKFREKRAAAVEGAGGILGSALRDVVRPGLQSVLYGLGAGAIGSVMYDQYQDYKRTQETYKEMFERFPELKEIDPNKVDDYWGIMNQYSPAMTRNPLVAGQFIKNMAEYNMQGVDFPTLKSILDIEGAANKSKTDVMNMLIRGVGPNV